MGKTPLLYPVPDTSTGELSRLRQEMPSESIAAVGADFGNVQVVNAGGSGLEILVHPGFNIDFLRHFAVVLLGDFSTACRRVAKEGQSVTIKDVKTDPSFKRNAEIAHRVSFRAVQSAPILDSSGKLPTMVSTHFRESRLPDEQQLEQLDLYINKMAGRLESFCIKESGKTNIKKSRDDPSSYLYSIDFFQGLDHSNRESLLRTGVIREYSKGDDIIFYGNRADRMFIVLNGWIKIYNANNDKRESGIMLLTQGNEFGAESVFYGGTYIYAARAETKSRILEIPAIDLKNMARKCPNLSEKIMHVLSKEIKQRQISEICLRHKKSTQRISCLLLRLTAWMNGKGGTFRMPYKKAVAAAQLDMDQATFSRALADMQDLGISTKESEITVKDFSLLVDHACQHCPMEAGQCVGRRMEKQKTSDSVISSAL